MNHKEQEELVRLFQEIIRIDSVSTGKREYLAVQWLKDRFEREGLPCSIYEKEKGRSNFVGILKGKTHDNPLVFLSHIDVVPAGDGWSQDPFGADIIDGCIYGRGTLDTKHLTIMQMYAMFLMKRAGIIPDRDVWLIASADEECGSKYGMDYLTREHPELFLAEEYISEGGGFVIEIGSHKYRTCCCGEKGVAVVTVKDMGAGGTGREKYWRLLKKAASYEAEPIITPPLELFREMVPEEDYQDITLKNLWEYSTKDNLVIPDLDTSSVDFEKEFMLELQYKYILPQSPEEITETIRQILDEDEIEIETTIKSRPYTCDITTPMFQKLKKLSQELDPDTKMLPMIALGNTDGRFIGKSVYGYSPILGRIPFRDVLKKVHQADECLDVESLVFGTELLYRLIWPEEKSRMIKTEREIALLRESAKRSSAAVRQLIPHLHVGMRETEVADLLHQILEENGMETMTYGTIVASGKRGADVHGKPTDKVIEKGDMVVVDFGAMYQGYTSDITRTIFFGEPGKKEREIFDIVLESYQCALKALETAETTAEVEAAHRKVFLDRGFEQYALNSLGHGLGLEIHEAPRLAVGQNERLVPGMVFTIEPGLYIPGMCGVRIEDDVLMTPEGPEMITDVPIIIQVNE